MNLRTEGLVTLLEPEKMTDPAAITTVRLGLSGAVMSFDVTETDPIPALELYDVDAASWWLLSLIGASAAETVAEHMIRHGDVTEHAPDTDQQSPTDETRRVDVDFQAAPLSNPLRRLGMLLWLHRWWPSKSESVPGLPIWLLDAEAGLIADRAEAALDEDTNVVENLFIPHLEAIATNLAELHKRTDRSATDNLLYELLKEAAETGLEVTDQDTPGYEVLSLVQRATEEYASPSAETLWESLEKELALIREGSERAELTPDNRASYALAAGDIGGLTPDGAAPVDPRLVRARVFATSGDAIAWWVHESDGGLLCDVEVLLSLEEQNAAPDAQLPFGEYFARVEYGGQSTLVALMRNRSESDPETWVLMGRAWLDATASREELMVTVISFEMAQSDVPARPPRDRIADMVTVRAVVTDRVKRAVESTPNGFPDDVGAWNDPCAAELSQQGEGQLR